MTSSTLYLVVIFVVSIILSLKTGTKQKGFRYHLFMYALAIIVLIVNEYVASDFLMKTGISLWLFSFLPLLFMESRIPKEITALPDPDEQPIDALKEKNNELKK